MRKKLCFCIFVAILVLGYSYAVLAAGEDVLARTGQYSFFINPIPTACITYHQKMVPCVVRETIPVPQKIFQTYAIPVPAMQKQPVVISEVPVGCPKGADHCATCYPRPTQMNGTKEVWGPRMVTVRVPEIRYTPREVTRKVLLPQWFAVTEQPRPIGKVRKVNSAVY